MKKGISTTVCTVLLAFISVLSASAQGYRIEATLSGLSNATCILGHYNYSNQQFLAKDTAQTNADGMLVFEDTKPLPGGLYLILLPGQKRWIEVVYSGTETDFSLATDTVTIVNNMVVKGSEENRIFYEYQKELRGIMEEMEALNLERKLKTDNVSTALVSKKMNEAQQQFNAYRKKFIEENKTTFTAKLLKASAEPEIPEAPTLPNGRKDSLWVFNYYKAHFWDNFDLTDERLLRAPFLKPKLDRYVKDLIVQVPDSINKDVDALVAKVGDNEELRSYIIYYVSSEYENPKVVGTEGVFVHMAEKYYLSGKMEVSDDAKRRIGERVATMKPMLVDKIMPDLALSDPTRKPVSIYGINADYTVLFFYSPTCGHCKEAAPKLKEFYDANKSKNVKVLAIATDQSPEDWKKYIQDYKLEELTHGYDFTFRTDYRSQFDVFATPSIYVLDKKKKIIARRMPVEQLDDFFNFYLRTHPETTTAVKAKAGK
ncbi:thioredoxin-like domain-containing protein [Arundinibacter roseus]|uniref:Redoxin domain-containing protein n=1 Tax=Arundinibacter roseus TaxID=2070510 RepID=A0A4R4K5F9_9BACT|nr:thioredoxin-like domain-containing protein [Arundinibacter roseus]TDB61409.1 redoxin domain-containing protein [Arundinibacter roseus]